jgi:bacterioferritin B
VVNLDLDLSGTELPAFHDGGDRWHHGRKRREVSPAHEEVPMSKFTDALNAQIANEFAASQQYVAIAVWFDDQTLPQLAAHFYRQAVEERNHAMIIVQYLLDAQKPVTIPAVAAPRTRFGGPVEPIRMALDQERTVTDQIQELAKLARREGDLVGEQFLAWFLKEQLEEMSSMSDLLTMVERAIESNILLAEAYLARTRIGDQGADPSAPPAAGGAL